MFFMRTTQAYNTTLSYLKMSTSLRAGVGQIIHIVLQHFPEINIDDVYSKTRSREIVEVRHTIFYFLYIYTHLCTKSIGLIFKKADYKGYDHTSVLYGCNEILNRFQHAQHAAWREKILVPIEKQISLTATNKFGKKIVEEIVGMPQAKFNELAENLPQVKGLPTLTRERILHECSKEANVSFDTIMLFITDMTIYQIAAWIEDFHAHQKFIAFAVEKLFANAHQTKRIDVETTQFPGTQLAILYGQFEDQSINL